MYGNPPFEIRYDGAIREGTAELYNWYEYGEPLYVLYFNSQEDHRQWLRGESFRLINHWNVPAKPPKYWK